MSSRSSRTKKEKPDDEATPSKRRVVSSACVPCRRRKSKCDGALPFCSTCTAVYRTKCFYDGDSEHKPKAGSKRDKKPLEQHDDALDVIVSSLRSLPDNESMVLLRTLRSEISTDELADTLRSSVHLPPSFGHETLAADFVPTPAPHRGSDSSRSGQWSGSQEEQDQHYLSSASTPPSMSTVWFRHPQDTEFLNHLLELYFCWIHPFHPFFSRKHFLHDLSVGRSESCSAMLLHAVLSFACHYSDRPMARTDPRSPGTAGDEFFAEAKQLLDGNGMPCIATVQALGVMAIRETSCGRDSNGYQYAGRAARMALELGLHLSSVDSDLRPADSESRKLTFWSVFNLETSCAVTVGRVSQLPRAATDIPKPEFADHTDKWQRYIDVHLSPDLESIQPAHATMFFNELCKLSELASDMVNSFYAPREPFTSRRLATYYGRYQQWYQSLPSPFWVENTSLPHVLVLHMYYYTCVIHLFRPYVKLDLSSVNLCPRDLCTVGANKISGLMDLLRTSYGLRRVGFLVPSLLLSSSTIHLLNLPGEEAANHLRQGIGDLHMMATNHQFAARCVDFITSLAAQWEISLPTTSAGPPISYERLPSPASSNFWTATIPRQQTFEGSTTYCAPAPSRSPYDTNNLRSGRPPPQMQAPNYFDLPVTMELVSGTPSQAPFWTPFPSQMIPMATQNMMASTATQYSPFEEHDAHWGGVQEQLRGSPADLRTTQPPQTAYSTARSPQPGQFQQWQWHS